MCRACAAHVRDKFESTSLYAEYITRIRQRLRIVIWNWCKNAVKIHKINMVYLGETLVLFASRSSVTARTIRRQTNSRLVKSRTSQLAETFDLKFALYNRSKYDLR